MNPNPNQPGGGMTEQQEKILRLAASALDGYRFEDDEVTLIGTYVPGGLNIEADVGSGEELAYVYIPLAPRVTPAEDLLAKLVEAGKKANASDKLGDLQELLRLSLTAEFYFV